LANHANQMAQRLRTALEGTPGLTFTQQTQANGVFVTLPAGVADELRKEFRFYDWNPATGEVRWMCAWDTTEDDIDYFADTVKKTLKFQTSL
jgi:threonine aldolase